MWHGCVARQVKQHARDTCGTESALLGIRNSQGTDHVTVRVGERVWHGTKSTTWWKSNKCGSYMAQSSHGAGRARWG